MKAARRSFGVPSLVALAVVIGKIPGGWEALVREGAAAHKFRVFHFTTDLTVAYGFWAGVIGAMVMSRRTVRPPRE